MSSAKLLGADCVELHTGKYCNLFNKKKNTLTAFTKLKKSALYAKKLGLDVHAGHGLTYQNVVPVAAIPGMEELNIGHSIVARALAVGLQEAVREMKVRIDKAAA